jgi:hypothetical protein
MTWAVRVNEIKMAGRPDFSLELWQGQSWTFARHDRLRVVYPTRYGRIVDVTCRDQQQADDLVEQLVGKGIPIEALRVIGGPNRVAK